MSSTKVKALRATWRKTGQHYTEQAQRFGRLFATTLIPQVLALGFGHIGRSTVIALIPGALEVTFRQFFPALGAAGADAAPGVTIVPEQVGVTPDPTADPVAPADVPVNLDDIPQDLPAA